TIVIPHAADLLVTGRVRVRFGDEKVARGVAGTRGWEVRATAARRRRSRQPSELRLPESRGGPGPESARRRGRPWDRGLPGPPLAPPAETCARRPGSRAG